MNCTSIYSQKKKIFSKRKKLKICDRNPLNDAISRGKIILRNVDQPANDDEIPNWLVLKEGVCVFKQNYYLK